MDGPNSSSKFPDIKTDDASRRNTRCADAIVDDLYKLERDNIIDRGFLLLELQSQCDHGEWLPRIENEFEWSTATVYRCIGVAKLVEKFSLVRTFRLGPTTFYDLLEEDEADLPAIIAELARRATKARLTDVIRISKGRRRFSDHPDATLLMLFDLECDKDKAWYKKAIAALLKRSRPASTRRAPSLTRSSKSTSRPNVRPHLKPRTRPPERSPIRMPTPLSSSAIGGPVKSVSCPSKVPVRM